MEYIVADDLELEPEVSCWSDEELRAFSESGSAQRPGP